MPKGRALVVDDQPDWRATLFDLLTLNGFEVCLACSRSEAMEILARDNIDIAVIDVRLDETNEANKDGLALMHEIRKNFSKIAVIILTGYAEVEMVQEALQPNEHGIAAAFGFLQKTETDQLIDYAKRALLKQNAPKFETVPSTELLISLEPKAQLRVEGRGSVAFIYKSDNACQLDIDRAKQWGSQQYIQNSDKRTRVKDAGLEMYRRIFEEHTAVQNGYQYSLGSAKKYRHMHLRFECARDLADLPLEFLFSPKASEHLALLHPLARQIREVATNREQLSPAFIERITGVGELLRILLLVSNTTPTHDLIDQIGQDIHDVLSPIKWIDLTILRTVDATIDRVRQVLKSCKYHIVHYVGHAEFHGNAPEQSSMRFWDAKNSGGEIKSLMGNELRTLLQDSDVRLVHLTACEGIKIGQLGDLIKNDYLGISDAIVQAGVPSVLGYRLPVSVDKAQIMTCAFYESFLRHGSPELALLDARQELAGKDKGDLTWASPILISHS
jgi:CheY-like chemotaxis protein